MDHRLFFVLGDLTSNILAGAIIGWLTCLMVSTGWNMMLAMFVMMLIGMILAMLLWLPAGYFFGAMESMLPMMLTGMVSAMVISMQAAMHPLDSATAFTTGATCGLACIVFVWVLNNQIRGTRPELENAK